MNEMIESNSNRPMSASATSQESRALQEARMEIQLAKMFPRDMQEVETTMVQEFENYSLAEKGMYRYPRGGQTITGLSIRAAEALARAYGNMSFGFKILEQTEEASFVVCAAVDRQRNVRVEREMRIAHFIKKKDGSLQWKSDPRDLLEHVTSWAQRGVRSVVLELIPKGLQERAENVIESTLKRGPKDIPLVERINRMVVAFSKVGVPKEYLERRLGHKVSAMTPDELAEYAGIFNSLRDRQAKVSEFFESDEVKVTIVDDSAKFNAVYEEIVTLCNKLTEKMPAVKKIEFLEDKLGVPKIEDLKKAKLEFIEKILAELKTKKNDVIESEDEIMKRLKGGQ